MKLLTRFVTHFTWLIVSFAIVCVGVGGWYGSGVFGSLASSEISNVNNSESAKVQQYLEDNFPQQVNDGIILFSAKDGQKATDPAYKNEVERLLGQLETSSVKTFYSTNEPSFISRDKTKTYAAVVLKQETDQEKYETLTAFRESVKSDIVTVNIGGTIVGNQESNGRVEHDLVLAEMISLPILAALLLFIFRGVIAALLPLALGVVAIIGGMAVTRLLTHVTDIDQYSINVITVLGLGLSIDYSLLIVSRFREELGKHETVKQAVRQTMDKAGHTILVSGLIVMASLLSLTLFPIGFLRSVGLGGASALLVAIIAALTLLPAILVLLGKRVNKWQVHLPFKKPKVNRWRRIGLFVMKYPLIVSGIVIVAIVAVASPALKMEFQPADYRILPHDSQTYIAAKSFATDFEGGKPGIQILYTSHGELLSTDGIARAYDFAHKVQDLDGVTSATSIVTADSSLSKEIYQQLYTTGQLPPQLQRLKEASVKDNTMVVSVQYEGELGSQKVQNLVHQLRDMNVPHAHIEIGGSPAVQYDTIDMVKKYLPYALAVIGITMFILLALLLRSVVIPLTAMVINTFALLVTFGVLVWIFQWGNLTEATWLTQTYGLDVTVPVLIFTIAFGLSMDYGVFLYSRIHEEYTRRKNNNEAILHGLEVTGPLITQAALLFFVVVAAFASSGIAMLQQIGVGLALAVLLDAFVVRIVFIPAVMKLLGKWNWWPGKR